MRSSGALIQDLGEGAWLAYALSFVTREAELDARLRASLPLAQEPLRIGAGEVLTPRLTSYHGDAGCAYRYSGRTFEPRPWGQELESLRAQLEERSGVRFTAALVNVYRDGRDAMGWHADDERELGPDAPRDVLVASVSLGAKRRFVLRHRRQTRRKVELALGAGDLLIMGGATQHRWQHCVPRTAKPVGARTNLTFRIVAAQGATG